jgi:hypothetical protein
LLFSPNGSSHIHKSASLVRKTEIRERPGSWLRQAKIQMLVILDATEVHGRCFLRVV